MRLRRTATAGGIASAADSAGFFDETLISLQHPQPMMPESSVSNAHTRERAYTFVVRNTHELFVPCSSFQSANMYLSRGNAS